jgi:hypothetical protein
MSTFSRRNLLEIVSLAAGGLALRTTSLGNAFAATPEPNFLIMAYFGGGWDQLLALDPRDQTLPGYKVTDNKTPTGIFPAYSEDTSAAMKAVLDLTQGRGIIDSRAVPALGKLSFGPAVHSSMFAHASDLSIVRGINMDTLTHEVGRRYFITGKPPRGITANGSSLTTSVAGQSTGAKYPLTNLAIRSESFNDRYPAFASPIAANGFADVRSVILPVNPLAAASDDALKRFEADSDSCDARGLNVTKLVDGFRDSRSQARLITGNSDLANKFNFSKTTTDPEVLSLYAAFGIDPMASTFSGAINGALGRAALAAQALTSNTTQVVSLTMNDDGLDDHFDMFRQQLPSQSTGWQALASLLAFLKTKSVRPGGPSYYDRTTLLVFSEFARTPMVNIRDGRDHHLVSSCLVKGPGIKGNTVFGASSEQAMGVQTWNFATGAAGNDVIRPSDVHATVLDSMGLSYQHLSNTTPRVIATLKK